MTLTVRDAALIMNAIAGTDPADPATAEADARRVDYAAALSARRAARRAHRRDALLRRLRHRRGRSRRRSACSARRARPGRDRRVRRDRQAIGRNEIAVLLAELKHDLNAYLATLPAAVRTRTLADVIAFNREHADAEMPLFGQDLFEQAEATTGLDEAYRTARATSLRLAGRGGDRPAAARAQCRRAGRADPCRRPG